MKAPRVARREGTFQEVLGSRSLRAAILGGGEAGARLDLTLWNNVKMSSLTLWIDLSLARRTLHPSHAAAADHEPTHIVAELKGLDIVSD